MIVTGRFVVVDSTTVLENAAVSFRFGRVARVASRARLLASRGSGERLADHPDAIVLPGLVNAHAHLDLSAIDGASRRGRPFAEWLRWIVAERRALAPERAATALRAALREAIRSGTTTFGDISSTSTSTGTSMSARELRLSGARAVVFEETISLDPARAADAERTLRRRLAEAGGRRGKGALVRSGVSPHAAYSVSAELFRRAVRLARARRYPLSVHAAETGEEREFVASGTGPLRTFLEEIGVLSPGVEPPQPIGSGRGPIDYLGDLGVLRRGTVLAHGNDLRKGEIERVARSGAAVVFCPGTHRYFGRPPHPLEKLLRAGVRTALGTDGLTSNDRLDLFAEMAEAARFFPRLRPERIFDLATRGGAEALSVRKGGRLVPGAPADLIVVARGEDASRTRDVVSSLVHGGPRRVARVLVGGRAPAALSGISLDPG